jgi:hypothetical protein
MFKIFRDRRGYDLKPHLPALYAEMGPQTAQIRYDFWRTLTEQYAETYYKRIRDWCDENGVIFTGHLLFEEFLRLAARCEGNMFKYLQHMHLIGVDHLYPKIGTAQEPDQHVALKVGSSAAHHFGSARLLCESMGGTYWDCTLERMKWMNNWEYVLGVNLFNNHGYHYTIEGERKRDWPPSQFYHHTWWPHYDRFTEYNARLSHLLSGGRHVAKVLMLYPINSIWTNYTPQKRSKVGDLIESDFQYLTDTMLRLHYDYDYVDEDVLAEATIEGSRLVIGDEQFSVFVLPPVTHIKKSTLDKLKEFVAAGGKVIADTLLPVGLLEADDEDSIESVSDFFGFSPDEFLQQFTSDGTDKISWMRPTEDTPIHVLRGPGLSAAPDKDLLQRVLNECAAPDIEISDEDVFYLHRVKDGVDIYFLTNTSQEDRGRVKITFERQGRPELWNPNDGSITPMLVYAFENGRTSIELDFPPSESHFVILSERQEDDLHVAATNLDVTGIVDGKLVGYARTGGQLFAELANGQPVGRVQTEARAPLPDIQFPDKYPFSAAQNNVLAIESWKMKMEEEGDVASRTASPDYDDSEWLDVTNGAWEMQLLAERDEQTYPVPLLYRTCFDIDSMPEKLGLMIDGFSGSDFQLWINGTQIDDRGERSWLDAEIRSVDITDHVVEGRNTVALRLVVTRRTDGVLDLLKIEGDFGLAGNDESGYRIAETPHELEIGDWTTQGFPFYSGTVSYRAGLDLPPDYLKDGGRLFLEADCGEDVLEVSVNGAPAKVAPWHPYRIDITDQVKAGPNEFEIRVTNTLINILEGVRHASGLFGKPRLVHEHRYELAMNLSD